MSSGVMIVKSRDKKYQISSFSDEIKVEKTKSDSEIKILELEQKIVELKQDNDRLEEQLPKTYAEAFEAGKQAAELNNDEYQQELKVHLLQALEKSQVQLDQKLRALESVALLVSKKTLEKIIGQERRSFAIIEPLIRTQLREFGDLLVLGVKVSQSDYDHLRKSPKLFSDYRRIKFDIDAALSAGDVKLVLQAGAVEISVQNYWQEFCQTIEILGQNSEVEIEAS